MDFGPKYSNKPRSFDLQESETNGNEVPVDYHSDSIAEKVKILMSFFRDFVIGINQIDHEKSENQDPKIFESNF